MEFRRYIELIRAHWGIVVLAFAVTTGLTALLVAQQEWVYESEGTFVVRPRTVQTEEIVRAFDTLNRGVEINATFAAIAESDLVRRRAQEAVEGPTSGLRISADVVAGTNMVEISVRGISPERVHAFAVAAGAETQRYVSELNDAFVLEQLDPPQLPNSPVGPNKALTIAVGTVFGLVLGPMLAVVLDYIGEATGRSTTFNVIDPSTGAYNAEYFKMRFKEELARIERTTRNFSVGEIRIRTREDPPAIPNAQSLRQIVDTIASATRAQDVICATEPGTLSVLFPELPAHACELLLKDWKLLIEMGIEDELFDVDISFREHRGSGPVQASGTIEQTEQPGSWV